VKKLTLIISFFFIIFPIFNSHSNEIRNLDKLFLELSETKSEDRADKLEKEIWAIWNWHPDDYQLTAKLELGTRLMYDGDYDYALKVFNKVIVTDPKWSEAWNKRATLFFFMKNFQDSLKDIEVVLNLEPRHFGALSGQAQIFIELKEYERALDSLKKAKKIHPIIRGNKLIPELEEIIKNQMI